MQNGNKEMKGTSDPETTQAIRQGPCEQLDRARMDAAEVRAILKLWREVDQKYREARRLWREAEEKLEMMRKFLCHLEYRLKQITAEAQAVA
jgi:hypothetical protein